MG
ncbi:hypothetical protein YPPY66_1236, partial [Yersinia pestis PY-66]|jgi:hypothetical protein